MPISLLALAASAFAIGTTEFVIMGLLPNVAADLHVSIADAGLLVSGYAAGVVVGGPLMVLLTSRLPFKSALLGLMSLFVVGNALCAFAPTYHWLMAARVVASLCHGSFFGTGALVAIRLAPPGSGSQALGLMFAGLTVANILGVPFGTMLGQALGWRATFIVVAAFGAVAVLALSLLVPHLDNTTPPNPRREIRVLAQPLLLLALAMTVFCFGGVFTVFTFITPILEAAGVPEQHVGAVLILFGVGSTLSLLIGGRLADWRQLPSIAWGTAALIALFVWFAFGMHNHTGAIFGAFAIGLIGFVTGPGLQLRSMQSAASAPLLGSTLNQSAFNMGNAGGAFLGASLLDHGHSYPDVSLAAAAVAALGLLLTLASAAVERAQRLRRPDVRVA